MLIAASCRRAEPPVRSRDQLVPAIEAERVRAGVPGAAVAVVSADSTLVLQGFGLRDVDRGLPVTPGTRFAIGSCTKAFTAIAALVAADRGLLALDDSPRRWLPWFHLQDYRADSLVTLRDLLSHRTGVPDDLGGGWYERYGTAERLVQAAMRSRPTGGFRTSFHYNNYMVTAAGLALGAAFGMPYEAVMTSAVLKPLGMDSSSLSLEAMEQSGDFSYGYADSARTAVPPTRLVYNTAIAPAANLNSTARDLTRWLRMLAGGGMLEGRRFLSDSAFRAMLQPLVSRSGGAYALGWFVEPWHGLMLYEAPGGVTGFGTRCELLPERRLAWVVLGNVDDQVLPKAVREIVYRTFVLER